MRLIVLTISVFVPIDALAVSARGSHSTHHETSIHLYAEDQEKGQPDSIDLS